MMKLYQPKTFVCLLLLLLGLAGEMNAQTLYGSSPFQDSMWAIDTTSWSISSRLAPSLAGFTITGMNGLAYDPVGHDCYGIAKVSGVSGRVLVKIDPVTAVCTQVGNLGDNFSSIAFREDGQLFGLKGDGAQTNPETMFTIDKTTGTPTLAVALGNGADGEVFAYNYDDDMFYHWSGNGTVIFEKFPATAPYTPVTNIPISGAAGGETFGSYYLGNNKFLNANISSNIIRVSSTGAYGSGVMSTPDDLRGLIMPPQFRLTSNDTVCQNDTVTFGMVNSAVDSAVYHWGDGTTTTIFPAGPATHMYSAPGSYDVHITLSNPTETDTMFTQTVRIQNIPLVALLPATDTLVCTSDSLTIVATSGGTSQWYMNGQPITGATNSNYTATQDGWYNMLKVNLNGCSDSSAVGIYVAFGDQPVADLGADSTICDGDSLCFALNNPGSVTYLWSNGSTLNSICATTSGTYGVTATDVSGCEAVDDVVVTVLAQPTATITVDTSNCPTLVFNSVGSGADTYAWNFGDTGTGTGLNVSHTYAANGTYTVTLDASNACFTETQTMVIDISCIVGVRDALAQAVTVSPNPSHGSFVVEADLAEASSISIKVHDVTGRLVFAQDHLDTRLQWSERVDLTAAPGIYVLTVEANGAMASRRIVIE